MAIAGVLGAPPVRAQDSPLPAPVSDGSTLTLDDYRLLLEDISAQLASSTLDDVVPPSVLQSIAAVEQVALPAGEQIRLVNLLQDAASVRVARARIALTLEQLELSARDNLAERTASLQRVLARPEFRENVSLINRIWGWIDDLLDWLFPDQVQEEPDPVVQSAENTIFNALQWALTLAGAVLISILLGYWMQRLVRNFVGDAELRRRRAAGDELPLTAHEARTLAVEQAQAGSFRAAVRSLYLSALLALEENEVIRADRTLTNRELLARTDSSTDGGLIKPALQPVVQRFDDVWYGMTEPDATTYAAYEQDIERLNRTIDSVTAPANPDASAQGDAHTGGIK